MHRTLCIAVVAVQLVGCSQAPSLMQNGSSVSQRPSTRHQIVQGGDGSLWETFTPPAPDGSPTGITLGPDGNMWFTQNGFGAPSAIGRIDMSGVITEYDIGSGHEPGQITSGSDGGLWFTDQHGIGRITTSGIFTEYWLPQPTSLSAGITSGSDGNVWYTDTKYPYVGKVTPDGVITEYRLPKPNGGRRLAGIANGPDGNVWFIDSFRNQIGRITPSGEFKMFSIPAPGRGIALGGDRNLYFTEGGASKIGEITRSGEVTEYALPFGDRSPEDISKGFSGASMWFMDYDSLGNTQLRQFILKTKSFTPPIIPPSRPLGGGFSYAGPDGNMWVPSANGSIVVALTHVLTSNPASIGIPGLGQTQTVQIHETQNKGGFYTAVSSDQSIATAGPVSQTNSFVVTAQAIGSCSVRVSDSIGNYIDVPVTVQ